MTNEWKLISKNKKSSAKRSPLYCSVSFSTKSSLYWCGSVNTSLKWNTLLSGKNSYLSVFSARNSLWTSCGGNVYSCLHFPFHVILFICLLWPLQPSNSLTADAQALLFPNINLTHAFSCFYISSCSFFSSSSFIPSSRAYWYKPCGCRPERWWWLGHVSNTGQAFWIESCWGGSLNVLRNDLWCLNSSPRVALQLEKCVLFGHCAVLFHFSYD